jgi:membrane protease YdiL (CAAX protease family)
MASAPTAPTVPTEIPRQSARTTPPAHTRSAPLAFIKRHSVLTYYALTFVISWGAVLIVLRPGGLPASTQQLESLGPALYLALLAGPSIAGILLTGLVSGRAGFRELLARLLRWRVGVRWYAVALLAAPLLTAVAAFALSLISPVFLPAIVTAEDKPSLVLLGIVTGLMVGILEELGWTGFAIPRLRLQYGVLSTGLMMGIVWGAWHFPAFWESGSFSAGLPLTLLLVGLFSWLPAFRLLMVWVYERTGSLLLAMLMHASLVAGTTVIFTPVLRSQLDKLTWILVWAAVLWVVVATVAVANRRQSSRQSLQRSMA